MEKQHFNIMINASREKVWDVMLGKETYPQWTAVFSENSRVETDWKKGSKALFLGGEGEGMVSEIADNVPNEFLSIRHLGMIKGGVEDFDSDEVKPWAGSMENYTFRTVGGQTELSVDMDIAEDYTEYFLTTWPKALQKVKEIAEK